MGKEIFKIFLGIKVLKNGKIYVTIHMIPKFRRKIL